MAANHPTPYSDVNELLSVLLSEVKEALGNHFIGMYLDGSLANGDFDQDSDIDFVVVTENDISGDLFLALRAMHERIAAIDSWWAIQLEGSYISRRAIRRHDPTHAMHPNIERGSSERLKMTRHDEDWVIHRHILRERGITLTGPAPRTLIDPVTPDELREAMLPVLNGWFALIPDNPAQIKSRGYQSYTVLSLCRILYTLRFGAVVSKPVAARWAQQTLDQRWAPLIERAWVGRQNAGLEAEENDIKETIGFINYILEQSRRTKQNEAA